MGIFYAYMYIHVHLIVRWVFVYTVTKELSFVQVLQEEIKHTGFINGGPGIYGVGSKVKVDQQALEEVHTCKMCAIC